MEQEEQQTEQQLGHPMDQHMIGGAVDTQQQLQEEKKTWYASLLSTGSVVLDELLCGGYERDVVTTIFGPSGAGKSTLCFLAALASVKEGKKVLFVDTEGGFSTIRFQQLAGNGSEVLERIFILKPTTFLEQIKAVETLRAMVTDAIGLIIIDTISMLYRIEIGRHSNDIKNVNAELGSQLSQLTEIARKKNIPILVTNQVYADFDEREAVKMVGGDLLKYGSKCLLELQKYKTVRRVVVKKHRFLPDGIGVNFKIVQLGLEKFGE